MTKNYLKPLQKAPSKNITVRISAELYDDIEKLKKEAEAQGVTVSVTEVVTDALQEMCRTARGQLTLKHEAFLMAGPAESTY